MMPYLVHTLVKPPTLLDPEPTLVTEIMETGTMKSMVCLKPSFATVIGCGLLENAIQTPTF